MLKCEYYLFAIKFPDCFLIEMDADALVDDFLRDLDKDQQNATKPETASKKQRPTTVAATDADKVDVTLFVNKEEEQEPASVLCAASCRIEAKAHATKEETNKQQEVD